MIAREGMTPLVAVILAAVLVLHFIGWLQSLVFWALALLVLVLFRDPERDIPSQPLAVVSPADGKVVAIRNEDDPYLQRKSIRVTVHLSVV